MITYFFDVTQTAVKLKEYTDEATQGNINQIKCIFNLSDEYKDLNVDAVFNGERVPIVNSECYAPSLNEVYCTVGVIGYIIENDKYKCRISPNPTSFIVKNGSYHEGLTQSKSPEPSELEKHYFLIKELVDSGKLQGPPGQDGPTGPPGKDAVIDLALSLESDNAIANSAATQAINENAKALEEAKKQLKSPRIQINEDVCVVSDMEDGTYEIANSKGSADIKVSAEGNVKMTLQNGELFSIHTDNTIRSITIFTGSGCWYIYDFDNENTDWLSCYCLTYDEASDLIAEHIEPLQNKVKNDLRSTNTKVAEALTIAKGKNRALVFTTFKELNDWINGEFVRDDGKTTADLQVGDNLYIVEVGVPDYWWDGNTIQVLETQKVDLSGYATKEQLNQLELVISNIVNGNEVAY